MTPDVPPAVAIGLGLGLAIVAFALYRWTFVERFYDHFVWQAAAFLEGRAGIRYPVATTADHIGNWFFQDVLPIGRVGGVDRGLIPFPPLPAILLMPFVAVFGLDVDDQLLFTALAAVDVALCWWMLGRLGISTAVRAGTTTFFAFGTVFWYTAQTTTTWYQAHIVAVGLTMLAVGLALGTAAEGTDPDERPPTVTAGLRIGLLVGLATTARLTVLLALPFFLLVGRHRGPPHAAWIAAGAGLPVLALLAYNVVATGQVFHPAYDHLYQLEARAYTGLGYRPDWAAEDPRYLPANLALMLLATPQVLPDRFRDTLGTIDRPLCTAPDAERTLFDPECPLAMPRDTGMSVLLTSPAFLLAIPAWLDRGRRRLVVAAVTAILLVSIANLMHFSQGWVQFGYRFSNDVVPFALVITAIGFSRLVDRAPRPPWAMPLAMGLITVSIGVNLWGVIWSRVLGW